MNTNKPKNPLYCEKCGSYLNEDKAVWLELSCKTGRYNKLGGEGYCALPPEESQGCFPFGPDCAKKVLSR